MTGRHIIGTAILILITVTSLAAANKESAALTRIDGLSPQQLNNWTTLSAADTCFVRHDTGIALRIDGWVFGNELYKSYLDPSLTCTNPYPYTIVAINMPMVFDAATPLQVSIDVETVDNSTPGCPRPGAVIPGSISSTWDFQVPAAGLYDVWIELDTPIVVNGPFFAGFFIGNNFAAGVNQAVTIDEVPVQCASYNIWDDTIGYVDLVNNQFWNFPGHLVLYAAGIPGGSGGGPTDPPPQLTLLAPSDPDTLYSSADLWASETSGSASIDYVSFEYATSGGLFIEIGRDYDGSRTLRDGLSSISVGDGYRQRWNFSSLTEGTYLLRATAFDTLGRTAADSATVYIEPTPPIPDIISPNNGDDFCSTLSLLMTSPDNDISFVQVFKKQANLNYSLGIVPLSQSSYGDANGNPSDGNMSTNGEFGDYYSAPVAAAMAIKAWFNRGYIQTMREGSSNIAVDTVVERFATLMNTRENRGNYDEDIVNGMIGYLKPKGAEFWFDQMSSPGYFDLRTWVEDQEKVVLLALGGPGARWVTVDGFQSWIQPDGNYVVRIADPVSGSLIDAPMRKSGLFGEVFFSGTWRRVEMMFSLLAKTWTVTRATIGVDINGADGWSLAWPPSGLTEDQPYFFTAQGRDATNLYGSSTVLLNYNCSVFYIAGDYDGDGFANVLDLTALINAIIYRSEDVVGEPMRADANCDGFVNITDIVYYMNFLFGNTGPPCR